MTYGKPVRSTSPQHEPIAIKKQRVEAASDFLSICAGTVRRRGPSDYQPQWQTIGSDSDYYWEDVQPALRIAAGLENWRQRPTTRLNPIR